MLIFPLIQLSMLHKPATTQTTLLLLKSIFLLLNRGNKPFYTQGQAAVYCNAVEKSGFKKDDTDPVHTKRWRLLKKYHIALTIANPDGCVTARCIMRS